MAIAYVDTSSAGSSATSNVSVAAPALLSVGHYVIATVTMVMTAGQTTTMNSAPSDLTLLTSALIPGGNVMRQWVYTGFVTSVPATYDWAPAEQANWSVIVQASSGVDTTTPVDVWAAQDEAGASDTSMAVDALNNTGTDDFQVACLSAGSSTTPGTTYTFPGGVGWGNQATVSPTSSAQRNSVMASRQLAAEDPAGFDVTASFAGAHRTVAIALNPVATGPPVPGPAPDRIVVPRRVGIRV